MRPICQAVRHYQQKVRAKEKIVTDKQVENNVITLFTTTRRFEGETPDVKDVLDVTSLGKGLFMDYERKTDFTKNLAIRFLEMPHVSYERKLDNNFVKYLMTTMHRETFRPELVRLAFCVCDEATEKQPAGTEFRVNGQHTCWAMFEMPENYVCPDKITVARYRAKTAQDMRNLYAVLDRGRPRTRGDVVISHLVGLPQFEEIAPSIVRKMSEGYSFYKWPSQDERHAHDGDDVAYLMQSEDASLVASVCAYLTTFSIATFPWLRRAPVIAAMFATFNKAVKASGEFWDAVRQGIGMSKINDPRLKLREALKDCSLSKSSNSVSRCKKRVSGEGMFHWSVNAWNAWREDRELFTLRAVLSAGRPKVK